MPLSKLISFHIFFLFPEAEAIARNCLIRTLNLRGQDRRDNYLAVMA